MTTDISRALTQKTSLWKNSKLDHDWVRSSYPWTPAVAHFVPRRDVTRLRARTDLIIQRNNPSTWERTGPQTNKTGHNGGDVLPGDLLYLNYPLLWHSDNRESATLLENPIKRKDSFGRMCCFNQRWAELSILFWSSMHSYWRFRRCATGHRNVHFTLRTFEICALALKSC